MKCEKAIEYIDQYFDDMLDHLPDEVVKHAEKCDDCRQYLNAGHKCRAISSSIRHESIQLKDPEILSRSILEALKDHPQQKHNSQNGHLVIFFQNNSLRKLIAAAAIILFAVFSYEQYVVLDKVNRLEYQYLEEGEEPHWEISTMKTYQQIRSIQTSIYAGIIKQDKEKQNKKTGILKLILKKDDAGITKLIQSDITWPGRIPLSGSGR
jgi:hypothetical protein